jgi:hypothetical protein
MISGLMIAAAIIPVAYDNLSVLRQEGTDIDLKRKSKSLFCLVNSDGDSRGFCLLERRLPLQNPGSLRPMRTIWEQFSSQ